MDTLNLHTWELNDEIMIISDYLSLYEAWMLHMSGVPANKCLNHRKFHTADDIIINGLEYANKYIDQRDGVEQNLAYIAHIFELRFPGMIFEMCGMSLVKSRILAKYGNTQNRVNKDRMLYKEYIDGKPHQQGNVILIGGSNIFIGGAVAKHEMAELRCSAAVFSTNSVALGVEASTIFSDEIALGSKEHPLPVFTSAEKNAAGQPPVQQFIQLRINGRLALLPVYWIE